AAPVAEHDGGAVALERPAQHHGPGLDGPDGGPHGRGDADAVPPEDHAVGPALRAEAVHQFALDGPVQLAEGPRGDGPLRGRRRTRHGAAAFGIEPATLELRDEVGEARLVALGLGEAVLRLARLRAVAAQRGLVTRLELSQVGQLLRLLAAQPLQLLLVLPQLAL